MNHSVQIHLFPANEKYYTASGNTPPAGKMLIFHKDYFVPYDLSKENKRT